MSRIDTSILPERPVTMSRIETDICIIGAGSGGLSVAAGAVQMGAKVVLIEGHKMGGDCLNYGCVPSKALLAAGHKAHETARPPSASRAIRPTRISPPRRTT
jgi:pyruvate/2-oxoglutarate dehydrogenase complex dihydrolipoamide dehydrogenase (E3) component